jgi:dTDP-4-amino-4,6-dideoxygalactose transaminase
LAKVYDETLSGTDLILPTCSPEASHVYHQYVVRSKRRDSLREFLLERNIGTLIHYPVPIHLQPAYQGRLKCVGKMMNTEKIVKEILSLPMYPELTSEQVTQVAGTIVSWYQNSVR